MDEKSEKNIPKIIKEFYNYYHFTPTEADSYEEVVELEKMTHYLYLGKNMKSLPFWYKSTDSGQPWFFFWITNVFDLLSPTKFKLPPKEATKIINYLRACQHPDGGFSGAPYMEPHVASTYAAFCTITYLGIEEAYSIVDREKLLQHLSKLKHNTNTVIPPSSECSNSRTTQPGGVEICYNGENDLRAVYCLLVIADICNFIDNKELREGIGDFVASCQTYEGGISCIPFGEAHAGYTYCGLASLLFLNEVHKIEIGRASCRERVSSHV